MPHCGLFPPVFETVEKGHGRLETRRIVVADATCVFLDFPGSKQIFRIEREVFRLTTKQRSTEIVFGITSLGAEKVSPQRLLELNRGHWSIENKNHFIRDTLFDEDRSRVRVGFGPAVLATLRQTSISTLKLIGADSIAAGVRACVMNSQLPLRVLGIECSSDPMNK